MKNKNIGYLIIILFLALVAVGVYWSRVKVTEEKVVEPLPTSTPQRPLALLLLSADYQENEQGSYIALNVFPETQAFVSAFELNIKLVANKPISLLEEKISPDITLKDVGWSFPIANIQTAADGINIQFSGYHIGENGYLIDKKITLATIAVEKASELKVEIEVVDENTTNFYAHDANSKIPLLINN